MWRIGTLNAACVGAWRYQLQPHCAVATGPMTWVGWVKWVLSQAVGVTIGVPLGLLLGLGVILSPVKTLQRKDRRGVAIQDPLPGLVHELLDVNGVRLHLVRTCTNPNGSSKPVLLLLHGFPEGWFSWRHQMEALRGEWCVAALDMRGYGGSDKPQDVGSYRMGKLVGDIAGIIRTIAPIRLQPRVALAGHDWGGLVAWHVAHMHPELVERLLVLCFPHPVRFRLGEVSLDQLRRCWYIFAFQMPWVPELLLWMGDYGVFDSMLSHGTTACKRKGSVNPQDIERYKVAFSRPGALRAAINYYRALVDEATRYPDPHIQQCLRQPLAMPVLVIWAEGDAVLRPQLLCGTERYAQRLRVHILPDCSHWAQQDRPEEVSRLMAEFLKEPVAS